MMNHRKIPVSRWSINGSAIGSDDLAVETIVKLQYNDDIVATLLASPEDLEHLLIGHLLCEGYLPINFFVDRSLSIDILSDESGYSVKMISDIGGKLVPKSDGITTSSCGACNTDGLHSLNNGLPVLESPGKIEVGILSQSLDKMKTMQTGFRKTGGMHCAGILTTQGDIVCIAEDIGRHNAVDKVIGKAIKSLEPNNSILLLSGRCGWDIVDKAARANIPSIASIGACSTLAAQTARQLGIRIYSFVKADSAIIIG